MDAHTEVNAKKETHKKADAIRLIKAASQVWAARGKKVVKFDMKKDKPSQEEVLKVVLGPTGNLRAPALVVGKKLIVGFNDEMYAEIFG